MDMKIVTALMRCRWREDAQCSIAIFFKVGSTVESLLAETNAVELRLTTPHSQTIDLANHCDRRAANVY